LVLSKAAATGGALLDAEVVESGTSSNRDGDAVRVPTTRDSKPARMKPAKKNFLIAAWMIRFSFKG
jgi:hypothetical protein